jgi:phosphoglycolate phosphatase
VTHLILFDIDGTLVSTDGAGTRAMTRTLEEVTHVLDGLSGIDVAGRTDAWILGEALTRHRVECDAACLARLQQSYFLRLEQEIARPSPRKRLLPGVRPLLDALTERRIPIALLTGNARRGAEIKLQHFDVWHYFKWGAFGDTSRDRNALLHEALQQVRDGGGPSVAPSQATVVGDTPLDIAVAVAGGARSLGVATGRHSAECLRTSGATAALDDLGDLDAALRALGVPSGW